jgi:hypothetical protein
VRRWFHYCGEVIKRAIVAARWVAGVVTVLVGGSILAAGGFLLHERHRVLAVVVVAVGVLVALLYGSFRVWDETDRELQATRARLRELDTAGAKRAYIDEMIDEATRFEEEIASLSDEDYRVRRRTIDLDIIHWENGVRATFRKSFEHGTDALFDSDEGLMTEDDYTSSVGSKADAVGYVVRRRKRLVEIREKL